MLMMYCTLTSDRPSNVDLRSKTEAFLIGPVPFEVLKGLNSELLCTEVMMLLFLL